MANFTPQGKFLWSEAGKQYLLDNYVNGNKAPHEIIEELHLKYPNKLYRALRHWGFPRRSRSVAQSINLEKNPENHPMKGKHHKQAAKNLIGEKTHRLWTKMTPEEIQKRVDTSRNLWLNRSKESHDADRKKSHEKLREASKHGSKFEKYIASAFSTEGYVINVHRKMLFDGRELEIDLCLPGFRTIIEINGPSHYRADIWGEDALKRTQERDRLKIEQLLGSKWNVISVNNEKGYRSNAVMKKTADRLIQFVKDMMDSNHKHYDFNVEA